MELYLAKYTLTKRQIKMQRNFYTAKLPEMQLKYSALQYLKYIKCTLYFLNKINL